MSAQNPQPKRFTELVGRTLTQIEVDEYHVKLTFGDLELEIRSEGGMGYNAGNSWLICEMTGKSNAPK